MNGPLGFSLHIIPGGVGLWDEDDIQSQHKNQSKYRLSTKDKRKIKNLEIL